MFSSLNSFKKSIETPFSGLPLNHSRREAARNPAYVISTGSAPAGGAGQILIMSTIRKAGIQTKRILHLLLPNILPPFFQKIDVSKAGCDAAFLFNDVLIENYQPRSALI
jgi:hypothetical protein